VAGIVAFAYVRVVGFVGVVAVAAATARQEIGVFTFTLIFAFTLALLVAGAVVGTTAQAGLFVVADVSALLISLVAATGVRLLAALAIVRGRQNLFLCFFTLLIFSACGALQLGALRAAIGLFGAADAYQCSVRLGIDRVDASPAA
jgi:hypothetical protein